MLYIIKSITKVESFLYIEKSTNQTSTRLLHFFGFTGPTPHRWRSSLTVLATKASLISRNNHWNIHPQFCSRESVQFVCSGGFYVRPIFRIFHRRPPAQLPDSNLLPDVFRKSAVSGCPRNNQRKSERKWERSFLGEFGK